MPIATHSSTIPAPAKAALEFARRQTLRLAQDIPSDKLCYQPVPNANHALWVLGHLAWCDDLFQSQLGGRKPVLDESWAKLFATGTKPTNNRNAYPPIEQIKAGLDRSRKALLEWLGSLDERTLATPLPDKWKEFAPTYGAVPGSCACHEGMHAGQLSVIRRGLGLAPTM
jgi:DinB family protein